MADPALRPVDINADIGEGLDDAPLMPYLTSVSIACGGHAGDEATMLRAMDLGARHGLRLGAHPGYPDREGFGRRRIEMTPAGLAGSISGQVEALARLAAIEGHELTHAKPHGALYNELWTDASLARLVAAAVAAVLPRARLVLPAGSAALRAVHGAAALAEAFLDRGYDANGHLLARGLPGAIVTEPRQLDAQMDLLASLEFETVCIHGDNPAALALLAEAAPALARHGRRPAPYEAA